MSIRALKTFLFVARGGTFAGAAKEMGITQAGVSLQMRALEEELKVKLFDRVGRSIVLNTTGRSLIPSATQIVERYEGLALILNREDLVGSLSLGVNRSAFESLLPAALLDLRRTHPRLEVQVVSAASVNLAVSVERGELDAAVLSTPPGKAPKFLELHHIANEPLVLIAPKELKIESAHEVLMREPYIRLTRHGWMGREIDTVLRSKGIQAKAVMEIDNSHIIARMVAQGFGIAIIPMMDGSWLSDPRLQIWRLKKPMFCPTINLLERRSHPRAALTSAFLICLRRQARFRRPENHFKALTF